MQASANAPACIQLPASNYGPTGTIAYAIGADRAPTPDCRADAGQVSPSLFMFACLLPFQVVLAGGQV